MYPAATPSHSARGLHPAPAAAGLVVVDLVAGCCCLVGGWWFCAGWGRPVEKGDGFTLAAAAVVQWWSARFPGSGLDAGIT